jgi:hypothetical protein
MLMSKAVSRTAAQHAKIINAAWQKGLEWIFETGKAIEAARADLAHGEYQHMVRTMLKMSPAMARKLRIVATNPVLSKRSNWNALPPAWTTLYQLTQLKDRELTRAIAKGTVNPKMQGEDVTALLNQGNEVDPEDSRYAAKPEPNPTKPKLTKPEFNKPKPEPVADEAPTDADADDDEDENPFGLLPYEKLLELIDERDAEITRLNNIIFKQNARIMELSARLMEGGKDLKSRKRINKAVSPSPSPKQLSH